MIRTKLIRPKQAPWERVRDLRSSLSAAKIDVLRDQRRVDTMEAQLRAWAAQTEDPELAAEATAALL